MNCVILYSNLKGGDMVLYYVKRHIDVQREERVVFFELLIIYRVDTVTKDERNVLNFLTNKDNFDDNVWKRKARKAKLRRKAQLKRKKVDRNKYYLSSCTASRAGQEVGQKQ